MPAFEYRQAQEIRECFQRHGVRYLFLGKSGAILLGFPDTTQDADVFVEKTPPNCMALVAALLRLHFLSLADNLKAMSIGRERLMAEEGGERKIGCSILPRALHACFAILRWILGQTLD